MTRPGLVEIARIDRELRSLCGLRTLPGWRRKADTLLGHRWEWMLARDRGFTVRDKRRASSR